MIHYTKWMPVKDGVSGPMTLPPCQWHRVQRRTGLYGQEFTRLEYFV